MSNYKFLNLIPKFQNKKNLVSHRKSKLVSLQDMYTTHSTLYRYISCAAVHVCPSEKKASAEAFDKNTVKTRIKETTD